MSKLNDFLSKNKIDPRRLLTASQHIESHRPEDRTLRLARRQAKEEGASDAVKELAAKKPRSGRPVTRPLLHQALAGTAVSVMARRKITRAVNHILEQKKKSAVASVDLF